MSNINNSVLSPERVMVNSEDLENVDHYIGYDEGTRSGSRKIRPTASPEFTITIVTENQNGDQVPVDYAATIVAHNVPEHSSAEVQRCAPVAVAEVLVENSPLYLLISTGVHKDACGFTDLCPSQVLVPYDGDPEDLLTQPGLFEPKE